MFLVDSLPLPFGSSPLSDGLTGLPPVAWAYLIDGTTAGLSNSAVVRVFCDSIARQGVLHTADTPTTTQYDKQHDKQYDKQYDKQHDKQNSAASYEVLLQSLCAAWQGDRAQDTSWQGVVEIVPRPGVTDTAGAIAARLLIAAGAEVRSAHSRRFWLVGGDNWQDQAQALIARNANPLLHQTQIYSRESWLAATGALEGTRIPQHPEPQKQNAPQESAQELRRETPQETPPEFVPSRFVIPQVQSTATEKVLSVALDLPPDQLQTLSKQGILDPNSGLRRGPLGLSLTDLNAIAQHFASLHRPPTDVELETLAQTWSEHCRHRIFAAPLQGAKAGAGTGGIFADFIRGTTEEILRRNRDGVGEFVVSTFSDNAGAVALNDSWLISDKVETHNSPSALDPFGGALTGILGVNRDCLGFGLGAQPIANRYGFFLPDADDSRRLYRDPNQQAALPAADKIVAEVIRGVGFGGNCSGIPTPQGFVRFGAAYRGKPLVFCGTVGLLPRHLPDGREAHKKSAQPGDAIVMAGGRVGKDGIHGATFSSEALDAGSPATAVQLGDPFTQKKLADTLLNQLRPAGFYRSLTDNGAGGLSSSVGEMAQESNGAEVWLDRVPLKYAGLAPWEIWISEAQERMTLAVPQEHLAQVLALFAAHEVEASAIGVFTDDGQLRVKYQDQVVADLSLAFLHEGVPDKNLRLGTLVELAGAELAKSKPPPTADDSVPETVSLKDLASRLPPLLAHTAIASHRAVSHRYDHDVQATVFAKPLMGTGGVNAQVTALRPVATACQAVALAQSCLPHYGAIGTTLDKAGMRAMAGLATESAVRQLVASGCALGRIALQDNFCWSRGEDPEMLTALLEAATGLREAALALNAPFISGKDSMFNEFSGFDEAGSPVAIEPPPTVLVSALGVLDDWQNFVSEDFKFAGDRLFLLGATCARLARTHYGALFNTMGASHSYAPPVLDLAAAESVLRFFATATAAGEIASATALGEGGLATALSRAALGGGLGAVVSLDSYIEACIEACRNAGDSSGQDLDAEAVLFAETGGRILCAVALEKTESFVARLKEAKLVWAEIGSVADAPQLVFSHATEQQTLELESLSAAYFSGDANYALNHTANHTVGEV